MAEWEDDADPGPWAEFSPMDFGVVLGEWRLGCWTQSQTVLGQWRPLMRRQWPGPHVKALGGPSGWPVRVAAAKSGLLAGAAAGG